VPPEETTQCLIGTVINSAHPESASLTRLSLLHAFCTFSPRSVTRTYLLIQSNHICICIWFILRNSCLFLVLARAYTGFHSLQFTTPPRTRKRKASGGEEASSSQIKKIKPELLPKLESKSPNTPSTTPTSPAVYTMDSDDEYMSGVSSGDDFDNIAESDDGLGKCRQLFLALLTVCRRF
jgi:hypothetical protein